MIGYYMDIDEIIYIAKKNPLLKGITLSGGEPFMQAGAMCELCEKARAIGLDIIIYTGYLWEELIANDDFRPLLELAVYIVDGPFVEALRTLELPFAGSSNQRVIDVKLSLEEGAPVLHEF
jgi:anaerobic ribonucleoside-triphosphate reductase activating protein